MLQETLEQQLQDTEMVEDESQSDQDEVASSDFDLTTFLHQLRDETDQMLFESSEVKELISQLKRENHSMESIVRNVVFLAYFLGIIASISNLLGAEKALEKLLHLALLATWVYFTLNYAEKAESLNDYLFQYKKQATVEVTVKADEYSHIREALYFELARGVDDKSLQEIITVWRNSHSPACDYVVTGETIAIARILAANNYRLENLVSAEELVGIDSWSTRQLAE